MQPFGFRLTNLYYFDQLIRLLTVLQMKRHLSQWDGFFGFWLWVVPQPNIVTLPQRVVNKKGRIAGKLFRKISKILKKIRKIVGFGWGAMPPRSPGVFGWGGKAPPLNGRSSHLIK